MRTLKDFLATHPNDPAGLFNLALDYATLGQRDSAIVLLQIMADAHTGMDPQGGAGQGRGFKSLASDPRFTALVARIERENPPVGRSTPVLTIRERDLTPEGIAYDPVDRVFYVSSMRKHKILRVGRDGSVSDFKSSGQDGLGATLGMKVDAKRRFLWVVSDDPNGPAFGGSPSFKGTPGGLFQYDLRTGALRFKHELAAGSGGGLNDVALRSDGEAFATNPGTGGVDQASPDHDGLEAFLPPKSVGLDNGIAFSSDNRVLFVAGSVGVNRVDMATRQFKLLPKPRNVSDAGLDGLYFHQGSLVGIQNPDLHPGRVVRYRLNPGLDSILGAEVLDAYDPLFDLPTTATVVGDSLFFVANPQIDKLMDPRSSPPLDSLQDLHLVWLKL